MWRSFAVIANTSNIKGKVRISIVGAAGRERQVVAKGRWPAARRQHQAALKRKRISRSPSPGTYTVKVVLGTEDNYPVATMSKVITIRPPR